MSCTYNFKVPQKELSMHLGLDFEGVEEIHHLHEDHEMQDLYSY